VLDAALTHVLAGTGGDESLVDTTVSIGSHGGLVFIMLANVSRA
jgi:hypothetical protein